MDIFTKTPPTFLLFVYIPDKLYPKLSFYERKNILTAKKPKSKKNPNILIKIYSADLRIMPSVRKKTIINMTKTSVRKKAIPEKIDTLGYAFGIVGRLGIKG